MNICQMCKCFVGMADPHALPLAVSTFQACQFIGRPECGVSTVLKYKFIAC